ncbi:MAG: UMP kinase [Planctomycetota bacterium]
MTNASSLTYPRIVLKLSGESLGNPREGGVVAEALERIATEITQAAATGVEIVIVCGGGNIVRGAALARAGLVERAPADHMGMLGTVINAIALREALRASGARATLFSAVGIDGIAPRFDRESALAAIARGEIVITPGGVGSPFFTTDSGAVLRAVELGCDAVFKATKVDGVYSADPTTDKTATRYDRLSLDEAVEKRLGVMDASALAMAREHDLPIVVFEFGPEGNIARTVREPSIGTLVTPA